MDLCEVFHKWYDIGIALKIPTAKLKEIEMNNSTVKRCAYDMLETWINIGKKTRSDILEALRSSLVQSNDIADKLEKKWNTIV